MEGIMKKSLSLVLVVCLLIALAGCAHDMMRSTHSLPMSHLIQPVKESRQIAKKTPLKLPTSVAILMAPNKDRDHGYVPKTTLYMAAEKLKQQLLANPKYVVSVAIVTMDDIQEKINLNKIRELYSTDIAILISHQQDQRTSQSGPMGFLDLTIIGAFMVPGVETKTSTVIDGRVVHIPSNAIIFMKSATDERSNTSTSYAVDNVVREESINGVKAAIGKFGDELTMALVKFDDYDLSQAVPLSMAMAGSDGNKDNSAANDYWNKVDTYKTSGGGAMGLLSLIFCAGAALLTWRRR